MGRKRTERELTSQRYHELDSRLRENEDDDPRIEAINSLPSDERTLIIMYLALGNRTALAEMLHISRPYLSDKLWRISVKLKDKRDQINKERQKQQEQDETVF